MCNKSKRNIANTTKHLYEYFNAINLFWDYHNETDGELVISKSQCNPAIVRGTRFLDFAVRMTRWGFYWCERRYICLSYNISLQKSSPMEYVQGSRRWLDKQTQIINSSCGLSNCSIHTHTHTHIHNLSLFLSLF